MAGEPIRTHLSHHDRTTVEEIFRHPTSGNVERRAVRSLLEAVATVVEEHNGHLKVTLGPGTEVLRQAGLAPDGSPGVADERTRDYGDDRWG